MKIEGRSFIITGGCGSLGGGTARAIIAQGGIAVVFDVIPEEKGNAIIKGYHAERAFYFKTDISDVESVQAATAEAMKVIPKGSLFGGVHCAAVATSRKWSNKMVDSCKDFKNTLIVNAYGTFVVDAVISDAINSQYEDLGPFGARVDEERGCIVNIASAVANPVPARCLTYGPSKTAVLGITTGAADFLGPTGIRVCSLSPSAVASKLMGDRLPYMVSELDAAAIFPRRSAEPEEVVDGIMFLLSNSMLNAIDLRVDGAWRTISNWGGEKDPRENAPALE
ncbi:3-hydroxyacyl-CoA dehydrogenase [Pseudohyphozyma bogoriensis]|nr:3-hydroxyacyl-CoA dehydrogenase [Pseudohyphozyma bogoriensis]